MDHKTAVLCMIFLLSVSAACVSPLPAPLSTTNPTPWLTDTQTAIAAPAPTGTSSTASQPIPTLTGGIALSNSVAFIVGDWQKHQADSLWIVNLDGSGEQRLVDVGADAGQNDITQLHWSSNRQWLSVTRLDSLRIVSTDGLQVKVIVGNEHGDSNVIFGGSWSPDSTRIAFTQTDYHQHIAHLAIADVETGRITYPITVSVDVATTGVELVGDELKWTSDSQWLLFGRGRDVHGSGLKALHISDGTVANLDESNCTGSINSLEWSATGKWLAIWEYGNGRYAHGWACLSSLTGEHIYLDVHGESTNPVWSSDARFVYLVAANFNPDDPQLDLEPRLMRFDLMDQRLVRLTSLKLGEPAFQKTLALSPDGQMLSIFGVDQNHQALFQIISTDGTILHELSINMQLLQRSYTLPIYEWSPNSQHLIFTAGEYETPDGISVQTYGSLYALDARTNQLTQLTGPHWLKDWAASPSRSKP